MPMNRIFTDHPHAVGETYVEHMKVALSFAGPLFVASLCAFVHAFLPFLFVTTASKTVKGLYARMVNRVPRTPIRSADTLPANGMPVWDPVI